MQHKYENEYRKKDEVLCAQLCYKQPRIIKENNGFKGKYCITRMGNSLLSQALCIDQHKHGVKHLRDEWYFFPDSFGNHFEIISHHNERHLNPPIKPKL